MDFLRHGRVGIVVFWSANVAMLAIWFFVALAAFASVLSSGAPGAGFWPWVLIVVSIAFACGETVLLVGRWRDVGVGPWLAGFWPVLVAIYWYVDLGATRSGVHDYDDRILWGSLVVPVVYIVIAGLLPRLRGRRPRLTEKSHPCP